MVEYGVCAGNDRAFAPPTLGKDRLEQKGGR